LKIAFVIPWYGKGIPGGAESECRKTALHLKGRFDVEVLTTCVRDFQSDWNVDFHKEGVEVAEGIRVRRFPVRKRDTHSFDAVNKRLMHTDMGRLKAMRSARPGFSPVSPNEEETYIRESVNSPALYDYIVRSYGEYDLFIFIPYMFGTTYFGSMAARDKAALIPCLHDESYAYLSIYNAMFRNARRVIFNSSSEERLARRLFGALDGGVLLGTGVDTEFTSEPERFRNKYSMQGPFVLYAGRKDAGKNTPLLVDFFRRFKADNPANPMKLVLIGPGDVLIPGRYKKEIIDLGFIEAQDKFDAYGAALCLCQPSVNESFSIVLMEAWACSTPALVHAGCEVTREFCVESGGGLYFSNYPEFAEGLLFMCENDGVRKGLGQKGSSFVRRNFAWDVVTERLSSFIRGGNGEG